MPGHGAGYGAGRGAGAGDEGNGRCMVQGPHFRCSGSGLRYMQRRDAEHEGPSQARHTICMLNSRPWATFMHTVMGNIPAHDRFTPVS